MIKIQTTVLLVILAISAIFASLAFASTDCPLKSDFYASGKECIDQAKMLDGIDGDGTVATDSCKCILVQKMHDEAGKEKTGACYTIKC